MTDTAENEDLWGYAKRIRFVCDSIQQIFPAKPECEIGVLDVGCGNATQLGLPLARRGFELTGIDHDERSIMVARKAAERLENASFICGSVQELDDKLFDVVILSEVLEHVSEPEDLLRATLKRMKRDGLAIITVPNGYGEFEWDSWFFRLLGFERLIEKYELRRAAKKGMRPVVSSTENSGSRHIQFFTLRRLCAMFRRCGLVMTDKSGSTLLSGPFAGHALPRIPGFLYWNARAADMLPTVLSSGWLFALRRLERGVE